MCVIFVVKIKKFKLKNIQKNNEIIFKVYVVVQPRKRLLDRSPQFNELNFIMEKYLYNIYFAEYIKLIISYCIYKILTIINNATFIYGILAL